MRCATVFAAVLVLVASAGSAAGQDPVVPAHAGELLGTVVDTADKTPVARASITIRKKSDSSVVQAIKCACLMIGDLQSLNGGFVFICGRQKSYWSKIGKRLLKKERCRRLWNVLDRWRWGRCESDGSEFSAAAFGINCHGKGNVRRRGFEMCPPDHILLPGDQIFARQSLQNGPSRIWKTLFPIGKIGKLLPTHSFESEHRAVLGQDEPLIIELTYFYAC